MSRALVTGIFIAATAGTAIQALPRLEEAFGAPSARTWSVGAYWILRIAAVVALTYFIARRPESRNPSRDPVAFVACFVALASVGLLRSPSPTDNTALVLVGDLISLISYVWLVAAVCALGRCFGVLPEARGLVTHGPYRLVRHPVYLGEIGAVLGLVLGAPSTWNLTAGVIFCAAQGLRMRLEELALVREFPQYAEYAAATPRLLPR